MDLLKENCNEISSLIETKKSSVILFRTLTEKNIFIHYDKHQSSFKDIIKKFYDNYDYKIKDPNLYLAFYSHELSRDLTEDDFESFSIEDKKLIILKLRNKINETAIVATFKEINLVKKGLTNTFDIFVRPPNSKTFVITTCCSILVSDFKILIYDKIGIPPNFQSLSYGGKILSENQTLDYYNINKDITIDLVIRAKGGMFHETSGKNGNYEELKDKFIYI